MNKEPLIKEKIFRCVKKSDKEGYKVILEKDVKLAVKWLLSKLDESKIDVYGDNVYKIPIWWVEEKIKKAFEGVIE